MLELYSALETVGVQSNPTVNNPVEVPVNTRLFPLFALTFCSSLGAQVLDAPRSFRPPCPGTDSFVVAPDDSYAVSDQLLGFSSEWFVWGQNFDTFTEYSLIKMHHVPTGVTFDTGLQSELAGVFAYSSGGRFLFQSASESDALQDWNLDGDMLDHILHSFDLETGTLVNHGLDVRFTLRSNGETLACLVQEASDENGDGDTDDLIVYAGDLRTGALVSSGVAAKSIAGIDDTTVYFLVAEEPGLDLNGDGDFDDDVFHAHDFILGITLNFGLADGPFFGRGVGAGFFVFTVAEADQGMDLNGDADQNDQVTHVFRRSNLSLQTLGGRYAIDIAVEAGKIVFRDGTMNNLAVADGATLAITDLGPVRLNDYRFAGGRMLYAADEGAVDRNGDGDTNDVILWTYELSTGSTAPIPRAFGPNSGSGLFRRAYLNDEVVLFRQDEAGDGVDWNNDGDTLDGVWGLAHLANGAIRNLRWAAGNGGGAVLGDLAALSVDHPTLGEVWVNTRTDGVPVHRIVEGGVLWDEPLIIEGLGLAGAQPFVNFPSAKFRVFDACP